MIFLLPLIVFAFGLLIGSFLNVVILRINTGRSVVHGASKCARCNRPLAWYELVPVFSFLALRGRCRTCKLDISFQYPLVELVTAILFVLLYSKILVAGMFAPSAWIVFGFGLVVASLLVVITVYDVRHKIIPDSVVFPFILLAFLSVIWRGAMVPGFSVLGGLMGGALVAVPFFLLWYFSKGKLMGFGDVKLMLGIGWLTGLMLGISTLILSFWIGGIVGLFLIGLTKRYGMKSEVPFGPFLIVALGLVELWGVTLHSLFPVWL
jgi:leader peptidase (prepilin peptidase)/N-methyltransferase